MIGKQDYGWAYFWTISAVIIATCFVRVAYGQDAKAIVTTMVEHEGEANRHKQHFSYVTRERSDRTGGRMWTERTAETSDGKVRFLIAEDDRPLTGDRAAEERTRLAGILADPRRFIAAEKAKGDEASRAKAMLDLLPKAYLLKNARVEGELTHIDFEPDPVYRPQSNEEKVLHGMAGWLTVETRSMRLRELSAKLPQDVSVGFGLATIHAGSNFRTVREMVTPGEWKTTVIDTSINGKAILFKSLGKNEQMTCKEFKQLPFDMTIAQAVDLVER